LCGASTVNEVVGTGQTPSTSAPILGAGGGGRANGVTAGAATATGVGVGAGGTLPGPGVPSIQGGGGGGVVGQQTNASCNTSAANPSASFGGNGSSSDVNNLLLASAAAAAAAAAGDGAQLSANAAAYAPLTPSSTHSSASPGTKSNFDYFQVRPGVDMRCPPARLMLPTGWDLQLLSNCTQFAPNSPNFLACTRIYPPKNQPVFLARWP